MQPLQLVPACQCVRSALALQQHLHCTAVHRSCGRWCLPVLMRKHLAAGYSFDKSGTLEFGDNEAIKSEFPQVSPTCKQ